MYGLSKEGGKRQNWLDVLKYSLSRESRLLFGNVVLCLYVARSSRVGEQVVLYNIMPTVLTS